MTKLVTDWQEFNLPATVLLSANMSFLAIQSVDNGGAKVKDRSAAQIASYISIVTSLGTVILSLLLVRQYRSKGSVNDAAKFLGKMTDPYGLETLAIWFALPYALLLWSTITFLGAFSFTCFSDSSLPTRIPVGSILLAVSVLIIWCIGAAWIKGDDRDERLLSWLADLQESCRSLLPKRKLDVELQEEYDHEQNVEAPDQKRSVDSPTCCGGSPVGDRRPEAKRQWSWTPRFSIRRATGDTPFESNELQTV
jgi:hypothetical protein